MSSSEEYLDSLLRSLTEMGNDAGMAPASSDVEDPASEKEDASKESVSGKAGMGEYNKAMSVDEIAAMFASMGEGAALEETESDDLSSEIIDPGEESFQEESDGMGLEEDNNLDDSEFDMAALLDDLESEAKNIFGEKEFDAPVISDEIPADDAFPDELAMDEADFPDELAINDDLFPEEQAMDDGELSDGLTLDDGMFSDGLTVDDGRFPDELALDDNLFSDELSIGQEPLLDDMALTDEPAIEEAPVVDGLALEEQEYPDIAVQNDENLAEDSVSEQEAFLDDFALEEGDFPDTLSSEAELLPDDLTQEEPPVDDFALEEYRMDDPVSEETEEDSSVLEEAMPDNLISEENTTDNFALEESMFDDLGFGESLTDDLGEKEAESEGSGVEESSFDNLGLNDLGLGDLGLDLNEEESYGDDMALEEGGMSEDDIDRLLSGDFLSESDESAESNETDDFALEESGADDEDLSALFAGMGADEDLSEINDLLEKSDQGVAVDDDMFSMLGDLPDGMDGQEENSMAEELDSIREITPEELEEREGAKSKRAKKKEDKARKKEDKANKKKAKKAAKAGSQADNESESGLDSLLGNSEQAEQKPKKQGVFGRILDFLLEEDEEESGEQTEDGFGDDGLSLGGISDENKQLLAELKEEDKKNAKKKDKKGKKGKKSKGKEAEAETEEENGEESEAKKKKPKKEKKKKKEKNVQEEPLVPEKKLSKKKVISVFLFCATIAACIIVTTILVPEQIEMQEARVAYDQEHYRQVYDLLYGKELDEEDKALLEKSSILLQVERKLDSYENYSKMDKPLEALNALVEGVSRYQNLRDEAETYHVSDELYSLYEQVLSALSENYGLGEADVLDIVTSEDNVTYSRKLESVISGDFFGVPAEDQSGVRQDVLPEEEEIIDRLQGMDETESGDEEQAEDADTLGTEEDASAE